VSVFLYRKIRGIAAGQMRDKVRNAEHSVHVPRRPVGWKHSMAYDAHLVTRIRDLLVGRPRITEKAMFGGIAWMLDGKMFAGVANNDLMVRIGPAAYESALDKPSVRAMDFNGRPMNGYVYVSQDGLVPDPNLMGWLEQAIAFVETVPAKPKRTNRSSNRADG
jgi:TfoX/Sxy family transcriptional regulator of competence genes